MDIHVLDSVYQQPFQNRGINNFPKHVFPWIDKKKKKKKVWKYEMAIAQAMIFYSLQVHIFYISISLEKKNNNS